MISLKSTILFLKVTYQWIVYIFQSIFSHSFKSRINLAYVTYLNQNLKGGWCFFISKKHSFKTKIKLCSKILLPVSNKCKPSWYKQSPFMFLLSIYTKPLSPQKFEGNTWTLSYVGKSTYDVNANTEAYIFFTPKLTYFWVIFLIFSIDWFIFNCLFPLSRLFTPTWTITMSINFSFKRTSILCKISFYDAPGKFSIFEN